MKSAGTWDRLVRSAWNYRIAFAIDLVAPLGWLAYGARRAHAFTLGALALSAVGFLVFGWLEYAVHRWVLHGPFPTLRLSHARHHAAPLELYSAPLFVILAASLAVFGALDLVMSQASAAFIVFGLYTGYDYFAVLHHLQHHAESALAHVSPLHRLERFHSRHHHRPGVNFGITTTFWDRVFGTYESLGEARKSGS